jgi:hypothetical protein
MGQLTSFVLIRAYPRHPRSNLFFFRRMDTASRRWLFLTWLRPHAAQVIGGLIPCHCATKESLPVIQLP